MLYSIVKQIREFQSIYSPNHIAANPKGYVKIPNVVEDIEKLTCKNQICYTKGRSWGVCMYIYIYNITKVAEKVMSNGKTRKTHDGRQTLFLSQTVRQSRYFTLTHGWRMTC